MKDYYKILGLEERASADEIHDRWVELIQAFHPDHGIHGEADEERAKEINEAYQVLKYSSTRMAYDFERAEQKRLKRLPLRKIVLPVSCLALLLVLSFLFLKGPRVPTQTQSNVKPPRPSSSQPEVSSPPAYEPSAPVKSTQSDSKPEPSVTVEKVVPPQTGQDAKGASVAHERRLAPPSPPVDSGDSVTPLPSSKGISRPKSPSSGASTNPSGQPGKKAVVHAISDPAPSLKLKDPGTELKPSPLIATEKEVRQFFTEYIERYTHRDIHGFLSFFSSEAIQNKKDGLEGIRRIYENFFAQSQDLRYRMEDTKIEIYQNAVEVKARYQLDQIPREGGEKKIWKGQILWILGKENDVLKIVSLDYQHQSSP